MRNEAQLTIHIFGDWYIVITLKRKNRHSAK